MNLPRTTVIEAGRTKYLSCDARGSPEPTITWLKNGQPLSPTDNAHVQVLSDGRQLQLVNVRLDETGTYTCIASNPVGVVDLDQFVQVIGIPTLIGPALEIVEVVESQSVGLLCNVTGNGQISINWQKNGDALDTVLAGQTTSYMQVSNGVSACV
jgi:hypothetical protein